MKSQIETALPGDPGAFRMVADYLRTELAAGAEALADRTAGERSALAGAWSGAAADAFGARAAALVAAGDGVAARASAAAAEIEALGEILSRAQSGLGEVRVRAAVGGLCVEGTQITYPADLWQFDLRDSLPLWELWSDLEEAVEEHRRTWFAALDQAAAFAERESSTLLALTAELIMTAAERTLLFKASRILTGQAEFFESEVRRLGSQIDDLSRAVERFGEPGDRALLEKLARERIDARDSAAAAHEAAPDVELPRELRGGLGLLDGALAGYGVYADIQEGESTEQAVVSQGAGLLAGAAGASLAGAAVGSWFPGPGTLGGAILGGGTVLIAGAAASLAGDKAVDHFAYGHAGSDDAAATEPEPDPGAELLGYASEALASPHPAGQEETR